jgi:protein MpaA
MRDYNEIIRRVENLRSADTSVQVLGEVEGYPIFGVERGIGEGLPTALVTGGVHGDEPAGVEAVLRFLERDPGSWLGRLAFETVVCVNPHGWVHDTRHNAQDVDINWSYARDDVVEVGVIKDLARDRRFEFVIDCHEDWESPGFYLYELRRGGAPIGEEIARRVAEICPLNESVEIEGESARGGLVYADIAKVEKLRGQGIPLELYYGHTDHLFTVETPTGLAMETRVAAQLAVLDAVIADQLK